MVEKKVNICDSCNKAIAENNCEICGKDICKLCQQDTVIGIANGGEIFHFITCTHCSNKLRLARVKSIFDDKVNSELRKKIIKNLKNAAALETIETDYEEVEQRKRKGLFGGFNSPYSILGQGTHPIKDIWGTPKRKKSFLNKFKIRRTSK